MKYIPLYLLISLILLSDNNQYLKENHIKMNFSISPIDFQMPIFNNELSNYSLFITSEHHGLNGNSLIQYYLFRYLYEKANVRILLREWGYSNAYIINEYLKTGNEKVLWGTYVSKRETIQLKVLYEFYQSLPENDKFEIIGIDREQYNSSSLTCFGLMIPDTLPPLKIRKTIKYFRQYKNYLACWPRKQLQMDIKLLINSVATYEGDYKVFFGKDYYKLNSLVRSIKLGEKISKINLNKKKHKIDGNDLALEREKFIFQNILSISKMFPNKKLFGQFGFAHTSLSDTIETKNIKYCASVASMLNCSTEFKDSVLVIAQFPYSKLSKGNSHYRLGFNEEDIKSIKQLSDEKTFTLFKLNGKNTPYLNIAKNKFQYLKY